MEIERLKPILEAALLASGRPLAVADLERLFAGDAEAPPRDQIRRALAELGEEWESRCLTLQEVSSGFRAQVRGEFEPWVARLWDEKPPRYSRALLETLAIIAYRQPITRSEIEDIRGVSVSTQIMRTLSEREWVRVVGHRDAPGKPAMYGTTRQFLDHFNLKTLDQLPALSEIREIDDQYPQLAFEGRPSADAPADETGEAVPVDTEDAAAGAANQGQAEGLGEPGVDEGTPDPGAPGGGAASNHEAAFESEGDARAGLPAEDSAERETPTDDRDPGAGDREDPTCTSAS